MKVFRFVWQFIVNYFQILHNNIKRKSKNSLKCFLSRRRTNAFIFLLRKLQTMNYELVKLYKKEK